MYRPRVLPQFLDATAPGVVSFLRQFVVWLAQELHNISDSITGPVEYRSYKPLIAPPVRIWEGMVAMADGAVWNPGGGKGLYVYYSGAWNKLG